MSKNLVIAILLLLVAAFLAVAPELSNGTLFDRTPLTPTPSYGMITGTPCEACYDPWYMYTCPNSGGKIVNSALPSMSESDLEDSCTWFYPTAIP